MNVILEAKRIAKQKHAGQVRKYTKQDYFWHPFRVATGVMALDYATEDMVATAFLHDTMEDCGMLYGDIASLLNVDIAEMVLGLTSYSKQINSSANRQDRKRMDLEYLIKQSNEVKVIKMIDRTDNLKDLSSFGERDFRKIYSEESRNLYAILASADLKVAEELKRAIIRCESTLQ